MEKNFCCEDLEYFTTKNEDDFENKNKLIYYDEKFEEYGIIIPDGGRSYVIINYCPWSGDKFPDSKRMDWFDELEKLGFEDPIEDFDKIPEIFKTGEWLQEKK